METVQAKPVEALGLRCPKCACGHFRTLATRKARGNMLRRYKACRHCGKRLVTFEVTAANLRKVAANG